MNTSLSHKPNRRYCTAFRIPILMFLLVYALSTTAKAASGIFIYRQSPAHPEGNSQAMEYNSFKRWESGTTFRTPKYGNVKVTKFQPLQILPYLKPLAGRVTIRSRSAHFWKQEYLVYLAAHNTYPASRVYLIGQVTQLKTIVEQLSSGNAWFEGKWMKDAKAAQLIAQRKNNKKSSANHQRNGRHNVTIEQQISLKKKELSALENQMIEVANQIKINEIQVSKLSTGSEQQLKSFNAEIMQLLKKIK